MQPFWSRGSLQATNDQAHDTEEAHGDFEQAAQDEDFRKNLNGVLRTTLTVALAIAQSLPVSTSKTIFDATLQVQKEFEVCIVLSVTARNSAEN